LPVSTVAAAPEMAQAPAPTVPAAAAPAPSPAPVAPIPRAVERARAAGNPPAAVAAATFGVTVADQMGRVVPAVPVRLLNSSSGQAAEGVTDQGGEWSAFDLAPGQYQLTVSKPGFRTASMGITIAEGQMARSRVVLQLGMLAETVVVSARPGVTPAAVGSARPGVATPTGTSAPQARHIGTAPTEDPCSRSAEGGCVTPPRKLVDAAPLYPAWAVEAGTSGKVFIKGRLRTDGSVGDMQPSPEANPDLASAAMQAVRLWEFSPVRLGGVPMEVDIEVTVQFVIYNK
jgi:TonB family protein